MTKVIKSALSWLWRDTKNSGWTLEDEGDLSVFLRSETGQRLLFRLRNSSISLSAQAVHSGLPHECGRASGYISAISDITNLSAKGTLEDPYKSEESADTGSGSLEHLIP